MSPSPPDKHSPTHQYLLLRRQTNKQLNPNLRSTLTPLVHSSHASLCENLSQRHPWLELVDQSSFAKPDSLSDSISRICKNLAKSTENDSDVRSVRDKLKKTKKPEEHPRVSEKSHRESSERRGYRNRERDDRGKSHKRRSRGAERRDRYGDRDRRSRRRSRSRSLIT